MSEAARIQGIPVAQPYPEDIVQKMTNALRQPDGEMTLLQTQAEACWQMTTTGTLFGCLPVGSGKTLTAHLAPTLLGSKRPLLLVRAALLHQMTRDLVTHQKHWCIHPKISMLTYHELSRQSSTAWLYRQNFDLIIADEAHKVSRSEAGRTLKLWHYFLANPECKFVPLSGTMTNKSIKEYWRLIVLALGQEAPIPFKDSFAMDAVAAVIDASRRKFPKPEQMAVCGQIYEVSAEPGARFAEESIQTRMRKGFQKRLRTTPGVVLPTSNGLDMSLELIAWHPFVPGDIKEAIDLMVSAAVAPNGQLIENHLETYQWKRQILAGFYYEFVWPNGEKDKKWMNARSAWMKLASQDIGNEFRYTEAEVREHYAKTMPDDPTYQEWCLVECLKPEPPRRVTWINDVMVRQAVEQLHEQDEGVLWFEHKAVGEKLRALGVHVYDEADADIDQEKSPKHFAASIGAHSEGRNLQRYWYHVVLSPPPSGKANEQLIGRSHRFGQTADSVEFHFAQYHNEFLRNLQTAYAQAVYVEETTGMQQRLQQANWVGIEKE